MKIQESVALVTGGGSGLGAAVCRHLAKQQAQVIVLDRDHIAATQVAHDIGGHAIHCDVTESRALEAAFAEIAQRYSHPLRIAINCAGIGSGKRMVGKEGPVPLSWFENIIRVNLIGTFNVMRLAAAAMSTAPEQAEGERGIIINTASIAAFDGQIGQTAYSASKGAIVSMTLPAARELARFGVRVMTIAPGIMDTPLLQDLPEDIRNSLAAQSLFPHRLGHPQEFAELVGHIITNCFLNGETIRLDGGLRMQAQ